MFNILIYWFVSLIFLKTFSAFAFAVSFSLSFCLVMSVINVIVAVVVGQVFAPKIQAGTVKFLATGAPYNSDVVLKLFALPALLSVAAVVTVGSVVVWGFSEAWAHRVFGSSLDLGGYNNDNSEFFLFCVSLAAPVIVFYILQMWNTDQALRNTRHK